jgi:hypothetical protein
MRLGVEVEKKLYATTTHGSIEEEPEPNLDQIIDNIQVEPFELLEFVELVVPTAKPTHLIVVATKSSQPIHPIVEHVQIENP